MALDRDTLEKGIYELFKGLNKDESTSEDRDKRIASTLTDLIENYVKSGTMTTEWSGTVSGNNVTGKGTGSIT